MRICIIGKFPPIEGGVSARTYWTAHGLAARGHAVHVVTNAKEVNVPFRMHMRPEDWRRCEATYDRGSVTVHWTDPLDRSQYHIPAASPFVSKLASIAARVHSDHPFDVILSYYMEPYGVAGHLAAQMTGAPHVARMAGSDAGRLWRHAQLEPLYDHVLRSAEAVVAVGAVAERAMQRGVESARIVFGGPFAVPEDVFNPFGPVLDFASLQTEVENDPELRDLVWGDLPPGIPFFGVYGKLGERKGTFALLEALHKLRQAGVEVGLAALAHGGATVQREFREQVRALGLADRVLQLPYLPNWRVPEFLRGCLAVCCLEQGFPISFHAPIIPREVLLCGGCLVGSAEVIRKFPGYARLPDGYGCAAIADVDDIDALSQRLAAIVQDREPLLSVRARGFAFAKSLQSDIDFPSTLEHVLEAAAARQPVTGTANALPGKDRFPFTRLARSATGRGTGNPAIPASTTAMARSIDLPEALEVRAAIDRAVEGGSANLRSLAEAVRIETDVAAAETDAGDLEVDEDPLFRLRSRRWAMSDDDLGHLVPVRAPGLRVLDFEHDAAQFLGVTSPNQLPLLPARRPSHIVAFTRPATRGRDPFLVDGTTARLLRLCDGTRTALEIAKELDSGSDAATTGRYLEWIEALFLRALICLTESGSSRATTEK